MQKLKGLLAHAKGDLSLEGFFNAVVELATQHLEKRKGLRVFSKVVMKESSVEKRTKKSPATTREKVATTAVKSKKKGTMKPPSAVKERARQAVPSAVWREVFRKAKGVCENCGSSHALEVEHSLPVAKGGANAEENLKILCRSCNQRAAIREYGFKKMSHYIKSPEANYGPG